MLHRSSRTGEQSDDELQFRFDDFLISLPPSGGRTSSRWLETATRSDSLLQGGTRFSRKVRRMAVMGDTSVGGRSAQRVHVVTVDSIVRRQHAGTTVVEVVIVSRGEGTALVRIADNTMLERSHSQTDSLRIVAPGGTRLPTSPATAQRMWSVRLFSER
jgi:hypothetical protein